MTEDMVRRRGLAKVGEDNISSTEARDVIWRSRSNSKTPGLLMKLIKNPEANEAQKTRFMRSFDFVSGPAKDAALLQLLTNSPPLKSRKLHDTRASTLALRVPVHQPRQEALPQIHLPVVTPDRFTP